MLGLGNIGPMAALPVMRPFIPSLFNDKVAGAVADAVRDAACAAGAA